MGRLETAEEAALRRYRNDVRFRAIVQSVVSAAMIEHGRIDPDRAGRAANEIATKACAILLETVFRDDAELNAQRQMAESYRKLAEEALVRSPHPPIFIGKPL